MTNFFAFNEGTIDRGLRIIIGAALVALTFYGPRTLWGLLGLVPLVTGMVGTCPLYSMIGIKTCAIRPTSATNS